MRTNRVSHGFTLIELVVVIAILGLFAGIAIPRYLDFTARARGSRIVADLRTIDSVITVYEAKTGEFPNIRTNGAGSDVLTEDNSSLKKYPLLAEWPAPPRGDTVIFPCDPTKTITLKNNKNYYICNETEGTAKFVIGSISAGSKRAGWTAEQLAEGGNAEF